MGEEVPYRTAVSEDDRVLALRSEGRSFGRIAKTVGLADGRAALDAFHRSLRRQAPDRQAALRRAELARLAKLSVHLDHCASFDPAELNRQRRVVERLRDLLLAE